MARFYVTGGRQRRNADGMQEWQHYEEAIIAEVNTDTGSAVVRARYVSPPEHRPDAASSIVFKSASLVDDALWVCTQTEVLCYQVPQFKLQKLISHRTFNDLHHVLPVSQDKLLICNTGLDRVQEFSTTGELLREWPTVTESRSRFSETVDYRKQLTTKPHLSHPNFLFLMEGEPWVTRFEQRDAIRLGAPERRLEIGIERPHDGVVADDDVIFTTVNGTIAKCSRNGGGVQVTDLNPISARSTALGWCRGLHVCGDIAWVGFSRLRPTALKQNLSWIAHGFQKVGNYNTAPTRIACYDLGARRLLREISLEQLGMNAVFSIIRAD